MNSENNLPTLPTEYVGHHIHLYSGQGLQCAPGARRQENTYGEFINSRKYIFRKQIDECHC
jgi:hypothetical protein